MSGAGKQEWGSVVTQVLNVFQSNCGSDASRTLPGSCVTGGGVTKSALHGSVGTLQFSPSGFFFLITQNAKRSSFVDMHQIRVGTQRGSTIKKRYFLSSL